MRDLGAIVTTRHVGFTVESSASEIGRSSTAWAGMSGMLARVAFDGGTEVFVGFNGSPYCEGGRNALNLALQFDGAIFDDYIRTLHADEVGRRIPCSCGWTFTAPNTNPIDLAIVWSSGGTSTTWTFNLRSFVVFAI